MTVAGAFLPGCYRHLAHLPGEGLAGYALRVAEGNGYKGMQQLLRLVDGEARRSFPDQLLRLRVDRSVLRKFAQTTFGTPEHLNALLAEALPPLPDPTEAVYFAECRIDRDALLLENGPICPQCLALDGYAQADWELAPVTICCVHGSVLRDRCERCGQILTWSRRSLLACGQCGARLAEQSSLPVEDSNVIETAEDFRALAPFRVSSETTPARSIQWDEMFRILKALLLSNADWASARWPRLFACNTSVEQRHQAIVALANCRRANSYDLARLRWKSDRALAPLAAIPLAHAKEKFARRFLEAEVGLSRESADAIAGSDAIPDVQPAYRTVEPWPPALTNCGDVARLLGVQTTTVEALLRNGRLAPPSTSHEGFDADAVVEAGRYLSDLVDLPSLKRLAGIEVPAAALTPYGLLPRWYGSDLTDHRVDPDRLLEIQRQLLLLWHRNRTPVEPIALRDVIRGYDHPADALVVFVSRIAGGQFDRVGWGPPFRWTDLEIERGIVEKTRSLAARIHESS